MSDIKIKFYDFKEIDDSQLSFAVMVSKFQGKWVYVRHRDRQTWEVPGGRREAEESIDETASRELMEETGATKYLLKPIAVYSVSENDVESYGGLFYAELLEYTQMLQMEIAEVKLFDYMPPNLTYPHILPKLMEQVSGIAV